MEKLDRIKELVALLNKAGKSYYSEGQEIMSNYEYDALYDELKKLEEETGCVLSDSPTVNVGYEVLSELPKERHDSPMLSLDKTKDRESLRSWLKDQKGLLSWKLDGLTIVLTYENGELVKAVTRGNGQIGEIITNNARMFKNIPVTISYKGRLVLRGEAIITYSDFNRINEEIPETDAKYKNPRNLCSGSVRQLNNKITKERNVNFFAFTLVSADGVDFNNSRKCQFEWLKSQGFDVVEYKEVDKDNILDAIDWFEHTIVNNDFPSDGLVIIYDDIAYGESLGRTAKFPRNAMAFKWTDETAETTLKEIEWSASRTGLINPVAIFEPVELEGTKVSRASVHNISIMESLKLGIGDTIKVFKANMIIPQIAENITQSGTVRIPEVCPVCGGKTRISDVNDVKSLSAGMGLNDNIVFLGYRNDPQNVIQQVDSVALCSYTEGLPLTPIEAFAHGKPMIATPVGGTVEIVKNEINGVIVSPGNIDEIASSILDLACDKEKYLKLARNAEKCYYEEFSYEIFESQVLSLYENL